MNFDDVLGAVDFAECGEGFSPADESIGVGDFFDGFDVFVVLEDEVYAADLIVVLYREDVD